MPKKQSKTWAGTEAAEILDRADRSGLTDTAFAKRHGVSPKRIGWWRKQLGRQKRPLRKARFVEVRAAANERIEIELRNGRRVSVPATIEPRAAAAFAAALEEAGC